MKFTRLIPFLCLLTLVSAPVSADTPTRGVPPPVVVTPAPVPVRTPPTPPIVFRAAPPIAPIAPIAPTVEFLGDSVTAGYYGGATIAYPNLVSAAMGWRRINQSPQYGLPNAAIPGSVLEGMFAARYYPAETTFASRVTPFAPDILVIMLGINDWNADPLEMNLATWRAGWEHLFAQIDALPKRPRVYVIGMPLVFYNDATDYVINPGTAGKTHAYAWERFAYSRDEGVAVWDGVTEAVAVAHGATFVPLKDGMTMAMYHHNSNGTIDLHPNDDGVRLIAARVCAAAARGTAR